MAPKRARRTAAVRDPWAGKVAVVTGASRGIGKAIAAELARVGCSVVLASRTHATTSPAPGALSGTQRAVVQSVVTDVRDPDSVAELFAKVKHEFGRLDVLVNNAGIIHALVPVDEITVEVWNDVIATNLNGMFYCTRAALPLMRRGSVIVNNLSIAAITAFPGLAAYDASKHGALGFTNTLREDLRERGIRVLAVIEGATDTEIWEQFMPKADRTKMMTPEAIASAVLQAISLPLEAPVEEIRLMPFSGTSRS